MVSRQAIWSMLASLLAAPAFAQSTLPPKVEPKTTGTVQIIPVSFKNENVAATVNGEKILVGDVKKILDQRAYPVTPTEDQKKSLRQAALEVLVDDVLMRQYLTKNAPKVDQGEFNKEVQELTDGLKKENKTLDMYLKETNQTSEQISKDIVARLQWRSLLQRFCPDDKAKPYYDANKIFFDKVFVRASHILIKLDAKATKADRDKAAQTLLVWRQEILAGKVKFEDIAAKYSDCPSKDAKDEKLRPTPGDVGSFPYKFVVLPEFSKAAYSMKVGEISNVVQTSAGLHLIKVTERTKGEDSKFAALKETVREVWAQDEDLYKRILNEQKKTGTIKIELP